MSKFLHDHDNNNGNNAKAIAIFSENSQAKNEIPVWNLSATQVLSSWTSLHFYFLVNRHHILRKTFIQHLE